MLQEERLLLQDQLKAYIEKGECSINSVSRSLNISQATLSTWLQNKYKGNLDNIDNIVINFLQREAERNDMVRRIIPFCKIKNAQRVFDTARTAHLNRQICVVYGEPGSGKTRAVKEYAQNHADVILIETDPGFSVKVLFKQICRSLGLDGIGHISDLFDSCVFKLSGTGMLLIVDEAEALPYKALELLRRLHDKAQIGILLSGMPRLYHNLRGMNGEYKQLFSRVRIAVKLEVLREEDTKMIVDSFFPDQNGVYKTFHKVSSGNGRTLEMLLLNSESIARLNKRNIDDQVVETASKLLIK